MRQQLEALRRRNVDLYSSAITWIALGETGEMRKIGLTEQHIPYLLQLPLAEVIALADGGHDLRTYLRLLSGKSIDKALRTALIQHGAPRELIIQLFGISTRHYAAERERLGVAAYGRPGTRVLDTATEHRIWRLWVLLANPLDPFRLRRADHWQLIALEIPRRLRSAWSLIQRWARETDARTAFAGDRARLTPNSQRQAEQDLRVKHGLPAIDDDTDSFEWASAREDSGSRNGLIPHSMAQGMRESLTA